MAGSSCATRVARARDAPRTEDALRANTDMTNSRVSIDGCRSVWPRRPFSHDTFSALSCVRRSLFRARSAHGDRRRIPRGRRPETALAPAEERPVLRARVHEHVRGYRRDGHEDEIAAAAKKRGLAMETTTFGPFFKITARRLSTRAGEEDRPGTEDADVIGEHDGFIAPPPFGILHMDSMRIYNSRVRGDDEKATMRSTFGLSILLGATSGLMAHEAGCRKVELLSIDDGNEYAPKLVKYYGRLGFKAVKEVGDNGFFEDLPHLLVWGGVGTRMDGDLKQLLSKWGGIVRKQAAAR